jgi:hypothetical protein
MTTKDLKIAPGAEKDWLLDWADASNSYLAVGETISSYTATVAGGIEKISDSRTDAKITTWVRCPATLAIGARASIIVAIVTSAGRKDSRRIELTVGYGALV